MRTAEDRITGITDASNLAPLDRKIWVVTTASLPWFTGTAINPLLRALCLTRGRPKHHVTLVVPWLENEQDRIKLYGESIPFSCKEENEEWIRNYARERALFIQEEPNLRIIFYLGKYSQSFGSIFPMVDICEMIPDEDADVAILEEPEHLNWFRAPPAKEVARKWKIKAKQIKFTVPKLEKGIGWSESDGHGLGWTIKFRHVVGILHTNYTAYIKQYGIGASIIAAPALGMLSSIVTRAYCHRVIRLSAVLPSLAPSKEITSNVHGVRAEFLLPSEPESTANANATKKTKPAKIYFIGKLMWAKGFDKLLLIQDLFREKTGEYFAIDVYGSGEDSTAITRAFFGREKIENDSEDAEETVSMKTSKSQESVGSTGRIFEEGFEVDLNESDIFFSYDEHSGPASPNTAPDQCGSLTILEDSITQAKSTSRAVFRLGENVVKAGFSMHFTPSTTGNGGKKKFKFDPPKSRFEFRRTPIPAQFLGVKDHALLRHDVDRKIFLNASVTEVLCTTTAEALSMGKFVIIPKHPSNEFFLQFPNCLSYDTLEECVEKLEFALANDPVPLSTEHAHAFTWEAATERLYEAAGITEEQQKKQQKEKDDAQTLARLHRAGSEDFFEDNTFFFDDETEKARESKDFM